MEKINTARDEGSGKTMSDKYYVNKSTGAWMTEETVKILKKIDKEGLRLLEDHSLHPYYEMLVESMINNTSFETQTRIIKIN